MNYFNQVGWTLSEKFVSHFSVTKNFSIVIIIKNFKLNFEKNKSTIQFFIRTLLVIITITTILVLTENKVYVK